MATYRAAFISTGDTNGFYTLRTAVAGPGFYKEHFIQNLGRDWAEVYSKYEEFCQRTGMIQETHRHAEWELNEWGSGGTADWSIASYMRWKAILAVGEWPMGKLPQEGGHCGKQLADLPWHYRNWMRKFAHEKIAEDKKFLTRSWQLILDALAPWQEADTVLATEAELRKEERSALEEARKAQSQHVGAMGERIVRKLTCTARFSYENKFFETMVVHKFVDEEGNTFTTYGKSPIGKEETATLKFTIKRHDDFKGEKQTIINRILKVE